MLELAKPSADLDLKLDLACGQRSKPGFEGVDICPGPTVKHVVNLARYPWPWEDDSVAEIRCDHYIEHIALGWIGKDGSFKIQADEPTDKEAFFAFFDECYRIMKPGAKLYIVTPCGRNDRAFQDPTHRRFIFQQNFAYLSKAWRLREKLDHYNVACDFDGTVEARSAIGEEVYASEVARKRFMHWWNIVEDWGVCLTALKGKTPALPKPLTGPVQAM